MPRPPAEQRRHRLPQATLGVLRQPHRAPADVLVGAYQDRALLRDLADPGPVVVDVGDLAPGADDHGLERDAEVVRDLAGGISPRLAGDPGDRREPGERG